MLDITNYYERLVSDHLWHLLREETPTPTQSFLEDVACVALNSLPARYIRHRVDMGSHMSEADYLTMEAEVDAAVKQAIEKVRSRSHEARE